MTRVWRIGYCPSPAPQPSLLLATLNYGTAFAEGRWHTKGPGGPVYCGSSRALTQLEKRVHANGHKLKDQALMVLDIPDDVPLISVSHLGLHSDWHDDVAATQRIGMDWLQSGASLGMWVPSFIEPMESNLLLNPVHPDYGKIALAIERHPFHFDARLFA